MEVVYPCCCGLDVHKKKITACVLWAEAKGKSRKEKRRFGTFTHDLGSASARVARPLPPHGCPERYRNSTPFSSFVVVLKGP